jgi:hypothetical protein
MAGVGLLTRIAKVAATLCLLTIAKRISGVGRDATVIGRVAAEWVLRVFSTIARAYDICDGKVSFRLENLPSTSLWEIAKPQPQRTLLLKRNHPERPSQIVTRTGGKE